MRVVVLSHRRMLADALAAHLPSARPAYTAEDVGRADVVFVDPGHPTDDAFALARRLKRRRPAAAVIFIAEGVPLAWIQRALAVGADGYLARCARLEDAVEALRAVRAGQRYFSPCAAKVIAMIAACNGRAPSLSARETDILKLTAAGRTAKEIARRLHLSPKTVESHRAALMRKTGARSAPGLVRYACDEHVVDAVSRFEPREMPVTE